jgi:signal transduction histidine kinase
MKTDLAVLATPSASLQTAQTRQRSALRWLRGTGIALIVLVVLTVFRTSPHPSLDGVGLRVLLALVCFTLASVPAMGRGELSGGRGMPLFVLLVLSSATLVWLQPSGAGFLGLFFAATLAAMRIRGRSGASIAAMAMVAFAIANTFTRRPPPFAFASGELGIVAFYVMGVLGDRLRQGQEQAERLLTELEETRDAQTQTAALAERARVAREMHDILAHSLSGLALQLAGARLLVAQKGSDPEIVDALDRAHHLARTGLEEARRAIGMLRGDALPGPEGLDELAKCMQRDAGVPCSLRVSGEERDLSSEVRLTLFRVAQEALSNVRSHAKAERVEIRLAYEQEGTCLSVEDFEAMPGSLASANPAGYGLTGMRERAELLGGTLHAAPTGSGFRVELRVPA